jgi:hypothetical protein
MNARIVYLMRGFPSCGKSYAAQKLCAESGLICETDEYFYTQFGEDSQRYDYDHDLLPKARQWNFEGFMAAVDSDVSPVVAIASLMRTHATRPTEATRSC